jgi:putative flippase GtrA
MIGEFLSYSLVGLANTVIGLVVIFGCLRFLGTSALLANAIGYAVGISFSFVMNGRLTFGRSRLSFAMFIKFVLVSALSYTANVCCVYLLAPWNKYLAESAGMAIYTATSFLLCRVFAFQVERARVT